MDVLDKVDLDKNSITLSFNIKNRSGNDVLKIEKLEKRFFEKEIFKNAEMNLNYGEKVALLGRNGSGKSTLIKMILEEDKNFNGNLKLGTSIKIGYIPQNIIFENDNQTVLDYFLEETNLSETEARNKLARYGFRKESVFKKIGKLSGGEK